MTILGWYAYRKSEVVARRFVWSLPDGTNLNPIEQIDSHVPQHMVMHLIPRFIARMGRGRQFLLSLLVIAFFFLTYIALGASFLREQLKQEQKENTAFHESIQKDGT
jgi:hypothetical protein